VQVYSDNGVFGSKGRNQRPGLDALLIKKVAKAVGVGNRTVSRIKTAMAA
jgi:hypothetical protein